MRNLCLAVLSILVLAGTSYAVDEAQLEAFSLNLVDALADMGMSPGDFKIRHDYARPDVFRLPLVDSLMHDPASLLQRIDLLAEDVETGTTLHEIGSALWDAMSVECHEREMQYEAPSGIRDVVGRLGHLPVPLRDAISEYLRCLDQLGLLRDEAIADVRADLGFLYQNASSLVRYRKEYEQVGPFELHRLEGDDEALADSVLRLSEAIDICAVAGMASVAISGAESLLQQIESILPLNARYMRYTGGKVAFTESPSTVTGKIAYMGLTDLGPVVVGGALENTYSGSFALIIDVGGDDTYNIVPKPQASFRLIIDHDGNDSYKAYETSAIAGATLGTSILMDLRGDDSYRSEDVSLGSAIYGAAILYDSDGDDTYTSGAFSQGAGFLGLGILCDGRGSDTYVAGMQSQGFGYVMGSGVLLERHGNDTYFTRMARTDILRYDDHYLTLSQGCGFGSRPDYSGGIGLLIDSHGNDLYSSDIFGQGVAYWFAVGALIDRNGHDRYCSYQYAQGSGIHLAFGLLVDEEGNDFYQSKGVSQGCGHDLALGLLTDFSGNDCYTVTDLSQGAGNANGTGILFDADGRDSYSSKSKVNVNGYGNYRREFGSIGLHIDARGADFYSARGTDESLWESGQYGIGIDVPAEAGKPRGDLIVNEYPFTEREFSPRELFILSSRGEPRFRAWREYAFDKMVEDSISTIAHLSTVLDTKDARERHTIKDILRKIGDPAVAMLATAVLEGNERAQAEASWILGLIGNRRAFDALIMLTYSDSWKLRSSALNALGKLKHLTPDEKELLRGRIGEVLTDTGEVFYVKKDAAFGAGRQRLCEVLPLLVSSLKNEHYSVRYSSSEAIRELSETCGGDVSNALLADLPELSLPGLVAALHAAYELPTDQKLDIAESALALSQSRDPHVALALSKLLSAIEPDTMPEEKRLARINDEIPRDSWKVQVVLGQE